MRQRPGYIRLHETGELHKRISLFKEMLERCELCPRRCGVDRRRGATGVCGIGSLPVVSEAQPHFGEEPPLVGRGGSGAIFMTGCTLKCSFCQNYDISHLMEGETIQSEELSSIMAGLQRKGCININFVTPTHQIPQIIEALPMAIENGLDLPLVYNCGGYESVPVLRLLEGIFDIYMPDFKWGADVEAFRHSFAPGYVQAAKDSILEMHRQVGDLVTGVDGVAVRGLIIRHLVLPEGVAGTREVMSFIADEVSPDTYVNVMDQYRPCYRASEPIDRAITKAEHDEAVDIAKRAGLKRIEGI